MKQLPVLQRAACCEYLIEDTVMARIDALLARADSTADRMHAGTADRTSWGPPSRLQIRFPLFQAGIIRRDDSNVLPFDIRTE